MVDERDDGHPGEKEDPQSKTSSQAQSEDPQNSAELAQPPSSTHPTAAIPKRAAYDRPPLGLIRADLSGLRTVDAMAGQHGVHGFQPAQLAASLTSFDAGSAIHQSGFNGSSFGGSAFGGPRSKRAETAAAADGDQLLFETLTATGSPLGCNAAFAAASAMEAIEWAIAATRTSERYKIVAMLHADHGRSGVGRTASGIAGLRDNYGPLMAGFIHVSLSDTNDLTASLNSVIDEQAAAILLPVVLDGDGGRPLAADVYAAAAEICKQRDLALIIDHTQVTMGSTGYMFAPLALGLPDDFSADAILYSAGLFQGIPGAVVLHRSGVLKTSDETIETADSKRLPPRPLQQHVAVQTLRSIQNEQVLDEVAATAESIAIDIAELASEWGIIRDISPLGMSIGLALDLPSEDWIAVAEQCGLLASAAGDHAVRLQLPLSISEADRTELLGRLSDTLSIVASTAAVSASA